MYDTVRRLPMQPTSISSRYVWLTAADWTKLSGLLRENFPEARYYTEPSSTSAQGKSRPPSIRFHDDILNTEGYSKRDHAMIVFSPDWAPVYVKHRGFTDAPEDFNWVHKRHARPEAMARFWSAMTEDELQANETMPHGDVVFYSTPDEKEHSALRQRFYRVLGKVATNRNQSFYRLPSRELIRTEKKGSMYWVGEDAIRWIKENPKRMFLYTAREWGFRPTD